MSIFKFLTTKVFHITDREFWFYYIWFFLIMGFYGGLFTMYFTFKWAEYHPWQLECYQEEKK